MKSRKSDTRTTLREIVRAIESCGNPCGELPLCPLCEVRDERDALRDGHDRMNQMLSDLWNFMVREDLIDAKLAEEAGPANDHESRGRLTIAQVAERVMAGQKRAITAASGLLEALRDLLDAIPDATLEADPPLRSWVNAAREAIAKAGDPVNDVGCKPIGDICAEHDQPLVCEHGCSMASPHCSGDPACGETEHRS